MIDLRLTEEETETLIAALRSLQDILTEGLAKSWIEPLKQNIENQWRNHQ